MKRLLLPLALLATTIVCAQTTQVTSPDNSLSVTMGAEEGMAFYTVSRYGTTIIGRSQ